MINNEYVITPTLPPPILIDCLVYTINFPKRKFVHIGLDPAQNNAKVVLILTPDGHIVVDFLQCIFNMMGNILSFLLDTPSYKKNIFLYTETILLSTMIDSGENVLVIESRTPDGCRVKLNRMDLMRLLDLESTIMRKINCTAAEIEVSNIYYYYYFGVNIIFYFSFLIRELRHPHP